MPSKKTKRPAPPVLLQIEVPGPSRAAFWKRPDGKLEFWAFKDRPRAFVNERIVFTFDRQPVAEARVMKIEAPGSSKCHATGQYERYHKVFWDPKKFVKYKTAAGGPAFYHLSRRTNRGSIGAKGLLPMLKEYKQLQRRPGIFLFAEEKWAKDYGFYFAEYVNQAVDVWEVRLPDGYRVSPDTHPDMKGFNAWVGYDSIPPENLRIVDTVLVPTSKSQPPKFSAEEHEDSFYWFEPGFPEEARKFIAANRDPQRTEFCEKESRAWANRLAAAGFPVELVYGDYRDPKVPDIALVGEHWWVEVGGKIFDPTAIQFGDYKPERDMYVEWKRHALDSDLVTDPAKGGWWLHRTRTGADKVLDVGEGDEYWAGEGNAASGVLPVCPKKGTVCLAMRSSQVMTPNCWGTIGGAVQEGMSPQQSAKSEMAEETGYHGGVTLHAAYVFTDRGFSYHNYVGVVPAEFAFHPGKDHGWETDHIAWVPYQEVVADMAKNPGDYHPGMLKLFSASKDLIERTLGIKKQAAARVPLDFDALYGKAFRVTDNSGDPNREGFSIITPENPNVWNVWKERPEFKDIVKQKLNEPGFLGEHKYGQIVRSAAKLGLMPRNAEAEKIPVNMQAAEKPRSKYDKVCHAIATDDALWDYFCAYVQVSDAFEDMPAASGKVVELIKSIPPFVPPSTRKCLYRGEAIRMGDDRLPAVWEPHIRELLSWSLNWDTAKGFAENRGIVWKTVGKIQGVALEDIVKWRNWTHPNESNYPGMQAEWFVLGTCKAVEADRPEQTGSKSAAPKLAWQEIVHSDPKGDTTGGILETDKELADWARDSASVEDMEGFMKALAGTKKIGVIDAMNSWFPGHGNGTEMLNKFVAECKAKGCDAIVLQAAVLNQQRKGFDLVKWYKRHGFYEFGYSKGIGPMMVKRLKNPLTRKKKGAEVTFRDENRDYHDDQSDMTLRAFADGKEVGRVEYAVFRGEPSVQWIEVGDRGKGYGPALLRELQRMFPDKQIDLGYTTDEGTKMVDKLKFRDEPSAEAPLFEELKSLVKERDWYQATADRFFEKEQHTEDEKQEFGKQMERMNAVHDRIWELEQATYGKSPAKRLIASRVNPAMLKQVAWEVRDRMLPDRDAQGGDCQDVSDAIVEELHKRGYADAFTMHGQWEGYAKHPHAWVEVGGYQVDATRDQFAVFMDDPKREAELLDNPVSVRKIAAQQELFPDSADARFRKWFDGSKVVDKQGQPLPVYHGTRSSVDFQEFSVNGPPYQEDKYFEDQPTSSGSGADPTAVMGAHFAEEPRVANQFAMGEGWTRSRYEGENPMPRVLKVYLRITNPKDFGSEHNLREFINQGKVHGEATDLAMQHELGIDAWEAEDNSAANEWYEKYEADPAFRAEANRYLFEDHRSVEGDDIDLNDAAYDLAMQAKQRLQTAGHDGVRYKNVVEGGHAWIAFEPNQIKSAWATQYDAASPNITASLDKEAAVDPAIKFRTEYVKPYPNPEGQRMSFRVVARRGGQQVGVVGVYIDNEDQDTARVMLADVADSDRRTGLGQMLYDKAIANAKRMGCTNFTSDKSMTKDAVKAWERLSQRYPVKSEGGQYSIGLTADWAEVGTSFASFTASLFTRQDPKADPPQLRSFEEVTKAEEDTAPAIALASKAASVPMGVSYREFTGEKAAWLGMKKKPPLVTPLKNIRHAPLEYEDIGSKNMVRDETFDPLEYEDIGAKRKPVKQ